MDMLWRRKSALFSFAFVYTGFASVFLSANMRLMAVLTVCVLFALSFFPPLKKRLQHRCSVHLPAILRIGFCAVFLSLTFFTFCRYAAVDLPAKRLSGKEAEITAVIQAPVYTTSYSTAYIADVTTNSGEACRVLLQTEQGGLTAGDTVSCKAVFSPLQDSGGAFSENRYYYSLRTFLQAEADTVQYLGRTTAGFLRTRFGEWREMLIGILQANFGREESALAAALFLGDRSHLPDTLNRDFRRLGISHLLAISGMHFTMLLFGLDTLLRLFLSNKKLRTVILAATDVGYMFLCGLSPSVTRAGLMMLLAYAALFFQRKSDTPTSLGIVSLFMCVADPAAIYSVALQLSVTAVLALCVFSHITRILRPADTSPIKRRTLQNAAITLLSSVAVQLVLLPLLCLYFGEVSWLTPISTVLFTPLIELILLLTPVYLLLHRLAPLSYLLGLLIQRLSTITEQVAGTFASLRGITLSLTDSFAPAYAITLSALLLLAPLCRTKQSLRRHLSAVLAVLSLFIFTLGVTKISTANDVRILSSAKGKNDAVTVMTAGNTLLIDVSDGSYAALHEAWSDAAAYGAVELEGVCLTHLHKKHINGVGRLTDTVYVRSLLLPLPETEEEAGIYLSLRTIAREKNIPVSTYTPADLLTWNDKVEILPEERLYLPRSTQPIITFTVRANGTDFVYLGAAASEITAFTDQTNAEIIVFGGHGPLYKTDIDVTVSHRLRAAVCRGNSQDYLSPALKHALTPLTVYADDEDISFVLSP